MVDWQNEREKIIGLGEDSFKKSYYPELQSKIEELEISQKNLDTIINSTTDGIVIHDFSGRILYLNRPAQMLLNIPEGSKNNFTVIDISSPKNNLNILQDIWSSVRDDKPQTIEWIVLQKETKKEIPVEVSINSTYWNESQVFVAVIRDFTLRKEYEDNLLKAKEKAEESERLKTFILQNISHEIRTPMNSIMGFSGLINDPLLEPEKRQEYTEIIVNSANRLLSIVDNVLTMSVLEKKQEQVNIQQVNINKLFGSLFAMYEKIAISRGLYLFYKTGLPDDESEIHSDKIKLSQILSNLLDNALKFTGSGVIEYGYSQKEDYLEFYVKDSGIGIPLEMQHKIFERFVQASKDIQLNYGGAGLGLSIVKEFVELLGGKIWVHSEPNTGSVFYFTIKHQQANKSLNVPISNNMVVSTPSIILIAEDEDSNYRYLEALLKKDGFIIIHTVNGIETVETCRTNANINLVLMDIKMPFMDGYTAAKIIKKNRPSLPIIAQSAYAMEYEIKKYSDNSFNDYITKPIDYKELNDKISRYLG